MHPPASHRAHLKHFWGHRECTEPANVWFLQPAPSRQPWLLNGHLHPFPAPILPFYKYFPGKSCEQSKAINLLQLEYKFDALKVESLNFLAFQSKFSITSFAVFLTLLSWSDIFLGTQNSLTLLCRVQLYEQKAFFFLPPTILFRLI